MFLYSYSDGIEGGGGRGKRSGLLMGQRESKHMLEVSRLTGKGRKLETPIIDRCGRLC